MHEKSETIAAASLTKCREMIALGDFTELPALLHPNVILRSPMVFKPFHGAEAVLFVISTASSIFKNFACERRFYTEDGLSVVLEFSANIDDKQLKGIYMIRVDEDAKIVEFEVMIRPFNCLRALGEEMDRRLRGSPSPTQNASFTTTFGRS